MLNRKCLIINFFYLSNIFISFEYLYINEPIFYILSNRKEIIKLFYIGSKIIIS